MKSIFIRLGLLALFITALSGCSGSDGATGATGATGAPGAPGTNGTNGTNGLGIAVSDVHGAAKSLEATRGPNNAANPWTTITAASVDANGKLVVDFKVTSDSAGTNPYTTAIPASSVRFSIAQLRPGDSTGDSTYWVNYVNSAVASKGDPGQNPTSWKVNQPGQETATAGTLTNNGNGTYHYVSAVTLTSGIDISANYSASALAAVGPPNGGVYAYNAANTHRVGIQLTDPDGAGPATMGANNATFNFVPNGGALTTREVVNISNCNNACHRTLGLHGGGRLDTKLCVTCHNPTNSDPESGNILDFKVMVHKIHTGKVRPSAGFDKAGDLAGLYKANPDGVTKGTPYVIWGFNNTKVDFAEVNLPANPANCVMCHKNAVDADNWKKVPTKEACGSCHDGINFAAGTGTRMWYPDSKITMTDSTGAAVNRTNVAGFGAAIALGHKGGAQTTNAACALCHTSTASASGRQSAPDQVPTVPDVHGQFADTFPLGWSKVSVDYTIDLSTDKASYAVGDAPIVTIVVRDATTGLPIDHTTINDGATSSFGSGQANLTLYGLLSASAVVPNSVNASDYVLVQKTNLSVSGALNLYVSGPRAKRVPALTTASNYRTFFSVGTGNIQSSNYAVDLRQRVNTTAVTTPASIAGTYQNMTAQDDYQTVYVSASGVQANGVPYPAVSGVAVTQTAASTKKTGVILVSNAREAGQIRYQLAPITANTTPGTYVAMVHAIKKSVAGVVPNSVSLAKVTFNVGQTTEEPKVAFGCPDCHSTTVWHDNAVNGANGNHPAKFDPDYCGSCHDYDAPVTGIATGAIPTSLGATSYKHSFDASGNDVFALVNGTGVFPAGSGQAWVNGGNKFGYGTTPIMRRVHAVHAGGTIRASGQPMINYPFEVYNGENVTITFPQDVKNCEKCHNSTTSGTWKTKPGRVACLACHDSDSAYAHATLQTLDSTPTIEKSALINGSTSTTPGAVGAAAAPVTGPFNGDEIESCPVCHAANP